MLTAKGKMRNAWDREKVEDFTVELDTLAHLSHFINYNYGSIVSVSFSGRIKTGEK